MKGECTQIEETECGKIEQRTNSAERPNCCWVSGMDGVLDEPMGVDLVNRICSGRLRETPSVLLVDDVRPVLMLQAMWLRTAGFEVNLTMCSTRH